MGLWSDIADLVWRYVADLKYPDADTSRLQSAIADLQALVPTTEKETK